MVDLILVQKMKSMKMNAVTNLSGSFTLELNKQMIQVECKGQSIELFFSSLKSVFNFITCYRNFRDNFLIDRHLNHINFTYYLGNELVGKSSKDLPPSRLGRYLGLPHSQFYLSKFLRYIFN